MKNYWIFAITEFSEYNPGWEVDQILKQLKEENCWKIGIRTVYKNHIKENDSVIFYVCGKGNQYFIASGLLNSSYINEGNPIFGYVTLKQLNIFRKRVYLQQVLERLSFITDKRIYGRFFQNGIIRISQKDYNLIMNKT